MTTRYLLAVPESTARYFVKVWRSEDHPRDPRTGRFMRKPGGPLRRARRFGERAAVYSASASSVDRVKAAKAAMPRGKDGWRDTVTKNLPEERRVDRAIRAAKDGLNDAREALKKAERQIEADFRRNKTPKAQREFYRENQLYKVRHEVTEAEKVVQGLEDVAKDPLRMQMGWADMVPADRGLRLPTDKNGVKIPTKELDAQLDKVLDVGKGLYDDFLNALGGDKEMTELETNIKTGPLSLSKIHDVKEPVRRKELIAERAKARRRLKAREQEVMLDVLGSVRSLGGVKHTKVNGQDFGDPASFGQGGKARKDWRSRLRRAERFFPDDWLRHSAGKNLRVASSDRAFHLESGSGEGSTLAMPSHARDGHAYDGGFRDHVDEVNVHELGHRMEMVVPGLRELEFAFVRRRAMKNGVVEPKRKMKDVVPGSAYRDDEVTFRDEWANPYAGKTYESDWGDPSSSYWEVFQVGLQDVYGRGSNRYGGMELQFFMLGTLATLESTDSDGGQ